MYYNYIIMKSKSDFIVFKQICYKFMSLENIYLN